ncbi:MAG: transglycosylase SLT domain-containing protein [Gammaproteobacteria bacterium]|nr:transglycosylase SLT domain-containing protein [Gammaproteobacteria bacterium]
MMSKASLRIGLLLLAALGLGACTSSPPSQAENVCEIFTEQRGWYRDAKKAEKRWGIPLSVLMAFTFQESSFQARAKPERTRLLWVIPWRRPSTAYGYTQALDSTWREYQRATGRSRARRHNFGDAMDFIGWYNRRSADQLGLPRNDAYSLYLAYHEGVGGFRRGTYRDKRWLQDAARRVHSRAYAYQTQLAGCERRLARPWWRPF